LRKLGFALILSGFAGLARADEPWGAGCFGSKWVEKLQVLRGFVVIGARGACMCKRKVEKSGL